MTPDDAPAITRPGAGRRKTAAPPLPQITPTDEISVERQVYQALRYALMSGAVRPGEALTSRSLSEAMGVSPTPVREALKRLDSDGALVSRNKSAFYVYEPDGADFTELYDIRLTLEGHATELAARRATPADIAMLRRLNDDYMAQMAQPVRDDRLLVELNFRFHFEVYRLSGSPILVELIEVLWLRIGPTLVRYNPTSGGDVFRIYHTEILEALERNDAKAAVEALRDDLTAAFRVLLPRLGARPQA